jgi:hypothetical protein
MVNVRKLALILGVSYVALSAALADGRAVLPPASMVQEYLHGKPSFVTRDDLLQAIIPGFGGVAGFMTGSGGAAVTWNPLDKSTNMVLSMNNLRATATGSGKVGVRATKSNTGGNAMYQVTLVGSLASNGSFGLGSISASFGNYVGEVVGNGVGYYPDGSIWYNGAQVATSSAYTAGTTFIVLFTGSSALLFRNGSSTPAHTQSISGDLFPFFDAYSAGTFAVDANFSPVTPSGYSGVAW